MSLGVGWQDCQSLAHTPTPPMTVRSSPHALFPCHIIFLMRLAFTTTTIFFVVCFLLACKVVVCSCSCAGTLRWLCPRWGQEKSWLSLGILRCRIYFALRDCVCEFSLLICSRAFCFPLCVAVGYKLHSRTDFLGRFSHVVSELLCMIWDAIVSPNSASTLGCGCVTFLNICIEEMCATLWARGC